MKKTLPISAAVLVAAVSVFIFSSARSSGSITAANTDIDPAATESAKPKKTLRAFRSEQELKDYFRQLDEKRKRDQNLRAAKSETQATGNAMSATPSAAKPLSDRACL